MYNFVASFGSDGSNTATTTQAAAGTFVTGEYVLVPIYWGGNTGAITSVADNLGNTYTQLGVTDLNGYGTAFYYCANAIGGAVTITVTWGAAQTYQRIRAIRYNGLTGAPQVSALGLQSNPAITTDAVTSGALTPTSNPAMLFAWSVNVYNSAIAAGTGFTARDAASAAGVVSLSEDKRLTSNAATAATFTNSAATSTVKTYALIISEAQTTSPGGGFKKLMLALGYFSFAVPSATFAFQDVGNAGWTIPTPTLVTGLPATYMSNTQVGSRLMYIDPVGGNDPSTQANALLQVYFWNGTNIVDQYGYTSPGGTGTLYGTDPLNPSGPVLAFKGFAICACKTNYSNPVEWVGDATLGIIADTTMTANAFRFGMPDWWLFKRGTTYDMYKDFRGYFDSTGRAGVGLSPGPSLRTCSGSSSANRAVIGVYGPTSLGRVRVIHQVASAFAGRDTKYQLAFGFMIDGSDRDFPVRPIDWSPNYPHDTANLGSDSFLSLGTGSTDLLFEDVHWHQAAGPNAGYFQWDPNFVGPTTAASGYDLQLNRCIRNDMWDEDNGATIEVTATRTVGNGAQSWAASATPTTLIWPTASTNVTSQLNLVSGVFTAAAANRYKFWATFDISANVAVGGTLRVSLYQNGTEIDFYTMPGTGALFTYQCYKLLRMGVTNCAVNDVFSIQVSTVNGAGTVTVIAGNARLVTRIIGNGFSQGIYMATHGLARYRMWQTILYRNGFNVDPRKQSNYIPDGIIPVYDWNIFNHNIYTVGDADLMNCHEDELVCMLGGAGPVHRAPVSITKNFIYEGYTSITAEHARRVYTTQSSAFDDNVFQRFRATTGTFQAHPGWGVGFCGGYNVSMQRNIVSDVAPSVFGYGQNAAGVDSVSTPYLIPRQLNWVNDPGTTLITGNIFDCTDSTSAVFNERNGETYGCLQWETPISQISPSTGDPSGTSITCTPKPGYTGTPTYQWYRGQQGSWDTRFIVTGATSASYPLTKAAVTFSGTNTVNQTGHNYVAGQTIQFMNAGGALPTGLTTAGIYFIAAAGLTANSYTLDYGVTFSTLGTGTTSVYSDWTFDTSESVNLTNMTCLVAGITYPPGVGTGTNTFSGNQIVMPATKTAISSYALFSGPLTSPMVPATSGSTIGTNTVYANYGVTPWPNPMASLKTYMSSLGVIVYGPDGFTEYDNLVVGNNPILTAMRRGQWDDRLLGKKIGNHVRAGRAMATLP